jgi:hypothetical protein
MIMSNQNSFSNLHLTKNENKTSFTHSLTNYYLFSEINHNILIFSKNNGFVETLFFS